MTLDGLQNKGDLRRFLTEMLQTPGVLPAASLPFKNVKFGAAELEWPGESIVSDVLEVTHGLGDEPTAVVATCTDSGRGVGVPEKNDTILKLELQTLQGDKPEAGTKQTAYWIAVC